MSIIVSGIKVPIDVSVNEVYSQAVKKAGIKKSSVVSQNIVKQSIDARRGDIRFVYSVALETVGIDEEALVSKVGSNSVTYRKKQQWSIELGNMELENPPVVVGFGPAGMFAALTLARKGFCPIVLERGGDVESRVKAVEGFWSSGILDVRCNVQFGEGGAGTFSDGKLTTRIGDPRSSMVLDEFVHFGAPEDILHKAKPHIGTDKLRNVVKTMREEIISLGGKVMFNTSLTEVYHSSGKITGVKTDKGEIATSLVIMAIGHSARDTFYMLKESGVPITSKAFSVGARIEHLQTEVNRSLYGKHFENPNLPIGEYQLSNRFGERAAYTFCMCPGGTVVPAASEQGGVVVNGMSEYARNLPNANSAFVVSVDAAQFGDNWDSGIEFQRKLEAKAFELGKGNFVAPAQTIGAFLGKSVPLSQGIKTSYALGVKECSLKELLPASVTQLMTDALPIFARKLACFGDDKAVLTGVETRTSSPVRIPRKDSSLESVGIEGLYPCGEGAGYAGGIMSAAVDGIKVSEQIISRFCPIYVG